MEAETKVMQLLGRSWKGQGAINSWSLQNEPALMTPDFNCKTQFGLLASRAERYAISVVGSLQPSVGAAPSPRTLRTPACVALPPAPCRLPPRAPRLLWLQTRVHGSSLETLSGTGHLKPQGSGAHTGLSPGVFPQGPTLPQGSVTGPWSASGTGPPGLGP